MTNNYFFSAGLIRQSDTDHVQHSPSFCRPGARWLNSVLMAWMDSWKVLDQLQKGAEKHDVFPLFISMDFLLFLRSFLNGFYGNNLEK